MHFNLFCSNPSPHSLLMLLVWPVLTDITDIQPRIQPPSLGELGLCHGTHPPLPSLLQAFYNIHQAPTMDQMLGVESTWSLQPSKGTGMSAKE